MVIAVISVQKTLMISDISQAQSVTPQSEIYSPGWLYATKNIAILHIVLSV